MSFHDHSIHQLASIKAILRTANAQYKQVADNLRCTTRRTYHARILAYNIGLRIDIGKAISCPQSVISFKPLPVLEVSPGASESHQPVTFRSLNGSRARPPSIITTSANSPLRQARLAHPKSPISPSLLDLRSLPSIQDIPSGGYRDTTLASPFRQATSRKTSADIRPPAPPRLHPKALPEVLCSQRCLNDLELSYLDLAGDYDSSSTSVSPQAFARGIPTIVLGTWLPAKRKCVEDMEQRESIQQPEQQQLRKRRFRTGVCTGTARSYAQRTRRSRNGLWEV